MYMVQYLLNMIKLVYLMAIFQILKIYKLHMFWAEGPQKWSFWPSFYDNTWCQYIKTIVNCKRALMDYLRNRYVIILKKTSAIFLLTAHTTVYMDSNKCRQTCVLPFSACWNSKLLFPCTCTNPSQTFIGKLLLFIFKVWLVPR